MRRVIGIDVHRTFGEVVTWENGVLRHAGRVDMTGTALEGLGKSLRSTDEVVIEATGNGMAVSRVLTAFVARVIIGSFAGEGDPPRLTSRPIRSPPARSPVCMRPGICRRLGRLTLLPNASAGWRRGATKSCGTCGSLTGSRRTWPSSTTRSHRSRSTIPRSED
ncbi:MAG: hypothetical protein WAU53_22460 [Rhodoplanes sp.]